jgi:predicted subunit of tRNA(5-methylaminomethyl-2-thiouridylate) methyltransferase
MEYERTLTGLNQILTQAWNAADTAESPKDRFMNLTLAKECYAMKIELLSSASIVDRAVQFVHKHRGLAAQNTKVPIAAATEQAQPETNIGHIE